MTELPQENGKTGEPAVYDIEKIFDAVLAFSGETDYEKLLDIILTKLMELTHSDAGTLYIIEDEKLHFRIVKNISRNVFQAGAEITLPPVSLAKDRVENISAYAAIHNEVVLVDDVYTDTRFSFAGPKHYDRLTGYRTRSMLALPLAAHWNAETEVLGVIQLLNAQDPATGTAVSYGDIQNPPVIPALASVAAQILANLMHMREIRQLLHSFVEVLTRTIDERSSYNKNHTQNVARYCGEFARYLKERFPKGHPYHFDDNRMEQLAIAALLHDIGKIATPLEIMDKHDRLAGRAEPLRYRFALKGHQLEIAALKGQLTREAYAAQKAEADSALEFIESVNGAAFLNDGDRARLAGLAALTYAGPRGEPAPLLEPEDLEALAIEKGTLTAGERAVMQEHAALTSRLLDSVGFWKYYKDVPQWACNHHEFLDGTGYPKGLGAKDLSIGSCVITIIDIFDALIAADRPYKKAMPLDKALSVLAGMAREGKLHKELVEIFTQSKISS